MPHADYPSDYINDRPPTDGEREDRIRDARVPHMLVRTPEAIREDIDARAERIPASDPAPRPGARKATPGTKRPITVTVSGERSSGKTTLIAIVAQALENSAHKVIVPKGTPSATMAVADLHEQFDITFVEADVDPALITLGIKLDTKDVQDTLAQASAAILALETQLADAHDEIAALKRRTMSPLQAEREIAMAFEEYRQAIVIDQQRRDTKAQADKMLAVVRMLDGEIDGRKNKAKGRLLDVLTGNQSIVRSGRTPGVDKLEQANAAFFAGGCVVPADTKAEPDDFASNNHVQNASAKLLAANAASMADETAVARAVVDDQTAVDVAASVAGHEITFAGLMDEHAQACADAEHHVVNPGEPLALGKGDTVLVELTVDQVIAPVAKVVIETSPADIAEAASEGC